MAAVIENNEALLDLLLKYKPNVDIPRVNYLHVCMIHISHYNTMSNDVNYSLYRNYIGMMDLENC